MATLASIASGNFTAASTWGLVDATSYLTLHTTSHTVTTAFSGTRTAAFTPGAITVSHLGIKISNRTGTTGTVSVRLVLSANNSAIAGTTVTINMSDIPAGVTAYDNGGWVFFKLSSPVTLLAATAYKLEVSTSSSTQLTLFRNATSANVCRALVTTTTQAPAATDNLIIAGERTGAATGNDFTVTMDNTASTDFGSQPTAANALLGPGIAICKGGTLTWGTTAATNYSLRISNSIIIFAEGTMNMGELGAECPRDSTMVLQFDCPANGDYGLEVRRGGTLNTYGLSRTVGKNVVKCLLNTDEAINSTSLGVDTDTGWLDNDKIAIGSTTRTVGQAEVGLLNGNAGASTLTVDGFAGTGGGLAFAHAGTSPTQAEIVLLTRNVQIKGWSSTLQSYIYVYPGGRSNCYWTEFSWLGNNTANKYGFTFSSTLSSTISYCSFYDFIASGSIGINLVSAENIDINNNTFYNLSQQAISATGSNHAGATVVIDNNTVIRVISGGFSINYHQCTVTNNLMSSCGGGLTISTGSNNNAENINVDNNTIHSSSAGFTIVMNGIIKNSTAWRCGGGMSIGGCICTIENATLFGNNGESIGIYAGGGNASFPTLINVVSNGDSSFATTNFIDIGTNIPCNIKMYSCVISEVSGIKTAHTNDININGVTYGVYITAYNTKLLSSNNVNFTGPYNGLFIIGSQKHNQTSGLHKTWKETGIIEIETVTTQAGGFSIKMTPNRTDRKHKSSGLNGGFKVAVANGQTCTPSVYVYEDASYNGARARLILLRNDAIGITSDTVIDTATAASDGAWEQLTGTTAAATDNGTMEFIVDCDGTAGNLFIDTFSATVA